MKHQRITRLIKKELILSKNHEMKQIVLITCVLASLWCQAQTPEEKLKNMGVKLPDVNAPAASYVNAVRVGNLLFLSGKGPLKENGEYMKGKLGKEVSIEQGYEAAKLTALIQLAVLKSVLGDLSKVK